jgi:hypothetical protein
MGRGLYQQSDRIGYDLIYFQQQVQQKAAREMLYIAYDKVEQGLQTMLGDIKGLEKWDPALRMVAQQLIAANHDLQFAVSGGDGSPARKSQVAYRQTLLLLSRLDTLEALARFVFEDQNALAQWNADFKALRGQLAELQKLQQSKASPEDLKAQFQKTDQAWETIVGRFKGLTEDLRLMLRLRVGQVDQVFARLAPLFGVTDRRPPLKTNFV